ncbi:GDP-fucose protein O-fucosyltransferase 2-like [Ostrinia furnacalis]|uniref:GDP-fucose protein O-fucosyltransferase 2-like n=1 Tax=Ostrinia furnacalis TaxID=93504 RepID=UPI00103F1731|nr:GDP-fucose protein O-fucosyltransferase 2-like [Ostrinia furnacalis]
MIAIILNLFLVYTAAFRLEMIVYEGEEIEVEYPAPVRRSSCSSDTCYNKPAVSDDYKFMFYDVMPNAGFHYHQVIYTNMATMLVNAHKHGKTNWRLVLTPLSNIHHWKNTDKPEPWSNFFDIKTLKTFAPVLEMHEVIDAPDSEPLEVDTLFVLQNYPSEPWSESSGKKKWQIMPTTNCIIRYDNIIAKTTYCVSINGTLEMLWKLVDLQPSDKKIMFKNVHLLNQPQKQTNPRKSWWGIMEYNSRLVKRARDYIIENFHCTSEKCPSYLAIHWRRKEFSCMLGKTNILPSVHETVQVIIWVVENCKLDINKVYIASDAEASELEALKGKLVAFGFETFEFNPSVQDMKDFKEGGIAIIDHIICTHAAYFIGTQLSKFTETIQLDRDVLGFGKVTSYQMFCSAYCVSFNDKAQCNTHIEFTDYVYENGKIIFTIPDTYPTVPFLPKVSDWLTREPSKDDFLFWAGVL